MVRGLAHGVRAPEEGPGAGGSGGGSSSYTQEDLDKAVQAAVAEANKGLEKNRDEILAQLGATRDKLRSYEGVDPEEFKALKEEKAERERRKAAEEGDFKALEQQLVERHSKAEQNWKSREGTLTKALEKYLIDAALSSEIANAKGLPKGLLPILRPQVKMVEKDGDFAALVVDSSGNPRISDGQATPMTLKDLVEEARGDEVLARMFEGTGSSGGGASRSAAGGGGPVRTISAAELDHNLEDVAKGKAKVAQ